MRFRHLDIGFRGQLSQWNIDRHEVLQGSYELCLPGSLAATKQEVVMTMRRYEIEMQF